MRAIASGGMATVYLARVVGEGGFERLFALKRMHEHLVEDPEFVNMFLDEARLAARIRHPNVVGTHDVQREGRSLYLVMDYVDGPSLRQLMKVVSQRGEQVDLGVGLRIFIDALAGLHAAHELTDDQGAKLNLVHRDISPSNVLVGRDGVSRITDFGVARAEARISSTRGDQLKGKIPYMAPEQLSRGPIDRRVDVHAAGCVLWELLTMRRLFRGDDHAQLLAAVIMGADERPEQVNPSVPSALGDVCMRALATVEDRFATAAEFADAVEDAAFSAGVRVARPDRVGAYVEEKMGVRQSLAAPEPTDLSDGVGPATLVTPSGIGDTVAMVTPTSALSSGHGARPSQPHAAQPQSFPGVQASQSFPGVGTSQSFPGVPGVDQSQSASTSELRTSHASAMEMPPRPSRSLNPALAVGIALVGIGALAGAVYFGSARAEVDGQRSGAASPPGAKPSTREAATPSAPEPNAEDGDNPESRPLNGDDPKAEPSASATTEPESESPQPKTTQRKTTRPATRPHRPVPRPATPPPSPPSPGSTPFRPDMP